MGDRVQHPARVWVHAGSGASSVLPVTPKDSYRYQGWAPSTRRVRLGHWTRGCEGRE